eukprot:SAG31_NODE_1153_length_9640_cov_2.830206_7_plen_126_part_00
MALDSEFSQEAVEGNCFADTSQPSSGLAARRKFVAAEALREAGLSGSELHEALAAARKLQARCIAAEEEITSKITEQRERDRRIACELFEAAIIRLQARWRGRVERRAQLRALEAELAWLEQKFG